MSEVKTKAATAMKSTIAVQVRPGITRLQIEEILEAIYKESGCTSCGLGGRDFHLHIEDPRFDRARLAPIAGIKNVVDVQLKQRVAIELSASDTNML